MAKRQTTSALTKAEGQITLFGGRETPDSFRKAVQVLHSKPQSPLTLLQRKLGNAWLKHAIESAPDEDGWWELSIVALAEDIDFDSNNRQYLKDSALALMRIVFEWDVMAPTAKRVPWKASVMFPEVEIHSDKVRYQLSSQMRDRMVNPEIYAMIDMNVVRRFRRASSLAIWEFCVRFEKLGRTAEVEWQKFRDMTLGESADNKTYQEYKYFKSKSLVPAIAEINAESDHTVALCEGKIGKRVSVIWFEVARKTIAEPGQDDERVVEVIGEIVKMGVPKSEASRMTKNHTVDEIRAALEYTKRRINDKKLAKLENPAAYFRQALANGYAAVEDASSPAAKTSDKGQGKAVDLREAFASHQNEQAEQYFNTLDTEDQAAAIERYNAFQQSSTLQIKKKPSRVAQAAFWRWLAKETWGEPTADQLLAFAQDMLASKAAAT